MKNRRPTPPPFDTMREPSRPHGSGVFELHLDDLVVRLSGISPDFVEELVSRYQPFGHPVGGTSATLDVAVGSDDREYFVRPLDEVEFNPVGLAVDGPRVRYVGYQIAGWFDTEYPGRGVAIMATGTREPRTGAMENYIRAAVAWQAAVRGGALIHAASAVLDGKAYLFYGESGAGKSTLAASSRRGTFVSDDLSLVLPRPGGGLDLIGSPFRGTYEDGPRVQGRFPLVAGFRLVQAPSAAIEDVPRVVAMAELVGNLPFVAEGFGRRPELFERFESAFADIPLARLRFRKDDSYWDAIAAAEF